MIAYNSLLVLITAAATLPAATISTSAICGANSNYQGVVQYGSSGGGPGSPHADCFVTTFDHGGDRFNTGQADVFINATSATASAWYSVYRFVPADVSASASYQNNFAVTFFGGSGFGIFFPNLCATGSGGGAQAVATLLDPAVAIPSLGAGLGPFSVRVEVDSYAGKNCSPLPAIGFSFAFGVPVRFGIALNAHANENEGRGPTDASSAEFLFSFNGPYDGPYEVLVDSYGQTRFQQITTATWNLVDLSVPEPGTSGLLGFTLAGVFLALRYSRTRQVHRST